MSTLSSAPLQTMKIDGAGLAQLRELESCSLIAYWDVNGYALGYGHHSPSITEKSYCSETDAESFLSQDTDALSQKIAALLKVPVNQGQFNVLVIFAYNVGINAFASSHLLSGLNSGDFVDVSNQLNRWIYSDGKVDSGLVARRAHEVALWKAAS